MGSLVYSLLSLKPEPNSLPSPLLARALACASSNDWRSARDLLMQGQEDPAHRRAVHFLLWEVLQALGQPEAALASLRAVLEYGPLTSRFSASPRRRILVLAVPGDFQANLPLGALLGAEDTELHTLWLSDPEAVLENPSRAFGSFERPSCDCVFIAIAEAAQHAQALRAADKLATWLNLPVINRGELIIGLSRAGASRLLQGLPGTVVPAQVLATRAALGVGGEGVSDSAGAQFPLIIRPGRSHAGQALERVDNASALRRYLDEVEGDAFYVAPFVDYRSSDGLWRKYRIIFAGGQPWPYHLAIHDDWAVWYYNARMDLHAWKREEESRFLGDIRQAFSQQAIDALYGIAERVGLDYFGLDCGLMPDGRLLVFEIETGMIVHDWDAPELFAYKSSGIQRIRCATEAMIDTRIARWKDLPDF